MKNFSFRIAAIASLALATVTAFAQSISWVGNWNTALEEAKKSNKLMMVSFYTKWDQYGKALDQRTYTNPDVIAASKKFVPIRLDVETNGAAQAKQFKVKYYPTILFIDKNQKVVGTIDGFETPDEFVKHANTFIKDNADFPSVSAKAAGGKDLDAVTRLGIIYANRYENAKAAQQLDKATKLDPRNKSDKLSDLYNAIGDSYQNASSFATAISYFQKAADTSKTTSKRAYAYYSIASCYLSQNQFAKMRAPLEAGAKLPGLSSEDKDIIDQLMEAMRRGLAGG